MELTKAKDWLGIKYYLDKQCNEILNTKFKIKNGWLGLDFVAEESKWFNKLLKIEEYTLTLIELELKERNVKKRKENLILGINVLINQFEKELLIYSLTN